MNVVDSIAGRPPSLRTGSDEALFGVAALLFTASAGVTIAWCSTMAEMGGMPMPGGWTMSMAWMLMPGQTWLDAALSFLGMWIAMMVSMMLPSLLPMLLRYRRVVATAPMPRLGSLTLLVGLGYFSVWIGLGVITFPIGMMLGKILMQQEALATMVPVAAGVVIVIAGLVQFTPWKTRTLACCRHAPDRVLPEIGTAWRHGVRLGLHCVCCCAGLTAILLVLGVMDLQVMAVVTAAITVERLAPWGDRISRTIGVVIISGGLFLIAQAAALA